MISLRVPALAQASIFSVSAQTAPPDADIHKILADRIDRDHQGVGRYEMAPNFILSITAQATSQGSFKIFPEADKEFFAKIGKIQISFHTGADGKATELAVHQGGPTSPPSASTKGNELPDTL